jgi:hypothetical protein
MPAIVPPRIEKPAFHPAPERPWPAFRRTPLPPGSVDHRHDARADRRRQTVPRLDDRRQVRIALNVRRFLRRLVAAALVFPTVSRIVRILVRPLDRFFIARIR